MRRRNYLSRRSLLQVGAAASGSLLLEFTLPASAKPASVKTSHGAAAEFTPNAFIRIDGEGRITLTMPYVEMGQGTYTSIPMLLAEELEVELSQVRLEHAPPNNKLYANPLLGEQATGNSNAVRGVLAAATPRRRNGAHNAD